MAVRGHGREARLRAASPLQCDGDPDHKPEPGSQISTGIKYRENSRGEKIHIKFNLRIKQPCFLVKSSSCDF